jgi:Elongation factor SelB, winged helix
VTVGAIEPEQRRVAERLVLAALRKFHREQPLSVDLRIDALVSRVRAAAGRKPPPRHRGATPLTLEDADLRRVIDEMADDGRLARNGRRIGLPDVRPSLDAEMSERVDRLLAGLRASGAAPPRVDGIAARLGIPPAVLDQLRAGGVLRQVAPGIDYPADVWSALQARIEGMGGSLSIARVRDELHTSRRHAEAIIAGAGRPSSPGARPRRPAPVHRRRSGPPSRR